MFGYFAKEWRPDSDNAEVFTRLGLNDKYAAKIAPPSQKWRSIRGFCENLILEKGLSFQISESSQLSESCHGKIVPLQPNFPASKICQVFSTLTARLSNFSQPKETFCFKIVFSGSIFNTSVLCAS